MNKAIIDTKNTRFTLLDYGKHEEHRGTLSFYKQSGELAFMCSKDEFLHMGIYPAEEYERLHEAAQPLAKYLKKNHNPHCRAIVECDRVRLTEDVASTPLA